jgi:hypothetical protein
MEENLPQVEPIWISEEKRNIQHKLGLVGFIKLEWNLTVLAVQISFESIMEVEWVLA